MSPSRPNAQPPRIVYAILSHSRPAQLERLIRVLLDEGSSPAAIVHHDFSAGDLDATAFERLGDVRVLRDWVNVEWGGFSMVEAMLAPMRAAVAGGEFDWLVLLSGQHYPVSPLPEIERFLAATEFDGFVDLGVVVAQPERLRGPGRDGARVWRRYYFGYRRMPLRSEQLPDAVGAALRRLAWAVSDNQRLVSVWPMPEGTRWRAGRRCRHTPFGERLTCRKGSMWLTLSRRAVEAAVARADGDEALVRHYRRTVIPDESFFQSVLAAEPGLRLSDGNLQFSRWPVEPESHPDVLRAGDFGVLVESGAHFARKFDPTVDSAILDRLDDHRRAG